MKFEFFRGIHCLVLLIGCLLTAVVLAKPVQLELRSVAEVKTPMLVLGDVVKVDANTSQEQAALLSMPIGTMLLTKTSMLVERKLLEKWVKLHAGMRARDVRWSGAEAVTVMLQTQLLDSSQIRTFAFDALKDWSKSITGNVEIKSQAELASLSVPMGEVEMRVSRLSEPWGLRKRVTILVDVLVADNMIKSVPVKFDISGTRTVLQVRHDVARGELLKAADVEAKDIDLFADLNEAVVLSALTSSSVRAKTFLPKGVALSKANVETQPDVLRGEFAVLLAHEGLVSIESRVEVMQDGIVGQVIKVRPVNSNNQIQAKIIQPGKVELY
ncbi:flagellar basal body P-ring formation chaperone FlgA [Undibacterium sp. JH2W]|uniref:flagellar basal body P-ring formation chaperone FlgA n=1 Tax=Undibacterium sp. JH2W TaxID=3413037 RepID=UPI003BF2F575